MKQLWDLLAWVRKRFVNINKIICPGKTCRTWLTFVLDISGLCLPSTFLTAQQSMLLKLVVCWARAWWRTSPTTIEKEVMMEVPTPSLGNIVASGWRMSCMDLFSKRELHRWPSEVSLWILKASDLVPRNSIQLFLFSTPKVHRDNNQMITFLTCNDWDCFTVNKVFAIRVDRRKSKGEMNRFRSD